MALKKFVPWVLFLFIFILLVITSYPSIGWWNSGGHTACAYNLSIPGPGDSILYVLLGRIFITLLFFIPVIKAVTLVSIISAGLAAIFVYFSLIIIFDNISLQIPEPLKIITAFSTSLSVPFLYSIWIEATVAREYVLGLLLTSILIYSSIKIWFSENDTEKRKLIFLIVFIMGLDFTAHRLNTPFLPVVIMLLIFSYRKELKQFRFWALLILFYLLGFSLHIYLLIRSPFHPAFAMDDVQNLSQLFSWIGMGRYGESNFSVIFNRRAPFWSYQVDHLYLRYFAWNFLGTNSSGTIFNLIYFSYIPLLLGLIGFVYSLIKKFKVWIIIFVTFFFFSFGLIIYSNTREGFDAIREIDRLFIPSFFVFMLWVGIGLCFLNNLVNNFLQKIKINWKIASVFLALLCFVILPINLIVTNWWKCDRSGFYFPVDFGYNLLIGCDKNGVLFTNGDNDTFPLWYLQSVEGVRPDVAVVNLSLLNTDYYVQKLQRKYKFFADDSDILSPDKFKPSVLDSPMVITITSNDSLTNNKNKDSLIVKYEGRRFGKKQGLIPQDKALISLLERNHWKKPIYFSTTVYAGNLVGLSEYLRLEGMVRQITPEKGDSLNPKQLENNLFNNYRFRNFNNHNVYTDRATINTYNTYRRLFVQLSQYYLNKGNKEKAIEVFKAMKTKLPDWRFTSRQNRFVLDYVKELKKLNIKGIN